MRERVRKEHRRRGLRGDAFVTHRVTQLYPEGACVYFYLAIYGQVGTALIIHSTPGTGIGCKSRSMSQDVTTGAGTSRED